MTNTFHVFMGTPHLFSSRGRCLGMKVHFSWDQSRKLSLPCQFSDRQSRSSKFYLPILTKLYKTYELIHKVEKVFLSDGILHDLKHFFQGWPVFLMNFNAKYGRILFEGSFPEKCRTDFFLHICTNFGRDVELLIDLN